MESIDIDRSVSSAAGEGVCAGGAAATFLCGNVQGIVRDGCVYLPARFTGGAASIWVAPESHDGVVYLACWVPACPSCWDGSDGASARAKSAAAGAVPAGMCEAGEPRDARREIGLGVDGGQRFVPASAFAELELQEGDAVTFLGNGLCFEVWRTENYRMLADKGAEELAETFLV